jgi:hypothetical protein
MKEKWNKIVTEWVSCFGSQKQCYYSSYGTSLALSLLADTFAVALSCVTELRGLLPWPAYLVYGGCGLTDGSVVTPAGVSVATVVAVGLFKLVTRRTRPIWA